MAKLSVNLNKFALIRNSRGTNYPDLIGMAKRTIQAGAHGITVHPRPDQRHVKYSDVFELSELLSKHPGIEFNIEGNPKPKFMEIVKEVKPDQCTLVPDDPGQLTSDHGWNLKNEGERIIPAINDLKEHGIRVSLFMDTDLEQIDIAGEIGTDRIEIYTEPYARAFGSALGDKIFNEVNIAACHANDIGLGVNAGHDLNLDNLGKLLSISCIQEVSIGHAIVVESFDYGFEETLRLYLKIVNN